MKFVLASLLLAEAALGASINARQSTGAPTLLTGDTSSYVNAAKYAQASYCTDNAGGVINGANVLKVWGNGNSVPMVYVAYNPSSNQIIVAHEGTDPTEIESLKTDADLFFTDMDSKLDGCGFPAAAQVHSGFQRAWASTADDILAEVNSQLSQHRGASVLVTGHSLGAAIATIDVAFLKCKIPGVNLRGLTFASPRAGNREFASSIPSFENVINGNDLIPDVPPKSFGYLHSPGEVWINPANSLTAYSCPGTENVNCADGIDTFDHNIFNHLGKYFGVQINGSLGC